MNGVRFMDVVPITAFAVSALTGVVPDEDPPIASPKTNMPCSPR
ncbi:hypothetical protein [Paraburkholderia sp. J12]|nr:hypothetical protein [Paraburkholderia sp. J12]